MTRRGQRQAHQSIVNRRKVGTWAGVVQPTDDKNQPTQPRTNKRDAKVLQRLSDGWLIFTLNKAHSPVLASTTRQGHTNIRQGTITRLEQAGLIVRVGNYAYRLAQRTEAPVPSKSVAEQLRIGVDNRLATVERLENAA